MLAYTRSPPHPLSTKSAHLPTLHHVSLHTRQKIKYQARSTNNRAKRSVTSSLLVSVRRHDLAFWHSCVQRRRRVRMGTYVCHPSHPQTDPLFFIYLFFSLPCHKVWHATQTGQKDLWQRGDVIFYIATYSEQKLRAQWAHSSRTVQCSSVLDTFSGLLSEKTLTEINRFEDLSGFATWQVFAEFVNTGLLLQ